MAWGDGFSLWAAMTFALPGVEEHEAESDRLCEHLSLWLQATGLCGWFVKAPLYVMFPLSLSHPPASFTLPFSPLSSWPADCRTATSSPVFSASCYHGQLFTFIFFHPSAPASCFFFLFSPRLRGWSPWGDQVGGLQVSAAVFGWRWRMSSCAAPWQGLSKPSRCFRYMHTSRRIHALSWIIHFVFTGPQNTRRGERGWGEKDLSWGEKNAGTVIWGTGVGLLIILVHSLNLPEQFEFERGSAIAVWTHGCTYLLKFSSLSVYACNVYITTLWYTCYCGCSWAMSLWHC